MVKQVEYRHIESLYSIFNKYSSEKITYFGTIKVTFKLQVRSLVKKMKLPKISTGLTSSILSKGGLP